MQDNIQKEQEKQIKLLNKIRILEGKFETSKEQNSFLKHLIIKIILKINEYEEYEIKHNTRLIVSII